MGDQIIQTVEPVRQFAKDSIRLVKRLPLQPPLASRSWASLDSLSNSSTSQSTTSSWDLRFLFLDRELSCLAVNLVANDTTFLLLNAYINVYECAANSILFLKKMN